MRGLVTERSPFAPRPPCTSDRRLRSGKSTLIGVLSSANLDDGRGSARSLVLRHRHEQENGRTSAVTMEIMGYSSDGQQVRRGARGGSTHQSLALPRIFLAVFVGSFVTVF